MEPIYDESTGQIINAGDVYKAVSDQLRAATARAEQAEAGERDAYEQKGEAIRQLVAEQLRWEHDPVHEQLETARRALENVRALAARIQNRGYRGEADHLLRFCEESGVTGSILRETTITSPDGQQVTGDGHVADEVALEEFNEAIRPKCQERLDYRVSGMNEGGRR